MSHSPRTSASQHSSSSAGTGTRGNPAPSDPPPPGISYFVPASTGEQPPNMRDGRPNPLHHMTGQPRPVVHGGRYVIPGSVRLGRVGGDRLAYSPSPPSSAHQRETRPPPSQSRAGGPYGLGGSPPPNTRSPYSTRPSSEAHSPAAAAFPAPRPAPPPNTPPPPPPHAQSTALVSAYRNELANAPGRSRPPKRRSGGGRSRRQRSATARGGHTQGSQQSWSVADRITFNTFGWIGGAAIRAVDGIGNVFKGGKRRRG